MLATPDREQGTTSHQAHINCLKLFLATTLQNPTYIYSMENRQHHSVSLHHCNLGGAIGDLHKGSVEVVPQKEYPHYTSRCNDTH